MPLAVALTSAHHSPAHTTRPRRYTRHTSTGTRTHTHTLHTQDLIQTYSNSFEVRVVHGLFGDNPLGVVVDQHLVDKIDNLGAT